MKVIAHPHTSAAINPIIGDFKEQEKRNLLIAVCFNVALLELRLRYSLQSRAFKSQGTTMENRVNTARAIRNMFQSEVLSLLIDINKDSA